MNVGDPVDAAPVASPCIGVCRLDAAGALCLGCARTLGEIAEWSRAGETRRRQIVQLAAQRRAALPPETSQ